jgi:transcriptional regulator with XRE-family HTH domain
MEIFTERFNEVLNQTGLTGRKVSEMLGIEPPTLVKYKKGISGMSMKTLGNFCRTFNVSANWLLGLSDKKELD